MESGPAYYLVPRYLCLVDKYLSSERVAFAFEIRHANAFGRWRVFWRVKASSGETAFDSDKYSPKRYDCRPRGRQDDGCRCDSVSKLYVTFSFLVRTRRYSCTASKYLTRECPKPALARWYSLRIWSRYRAHDGTIFRERSVTR